MNLHEFIFSKGHYRLMRHVIFWTAWLLFSACVQVTNLPATVAWGDLAVYQLLRAFSRLPSHLLFCYVTVYYLIPLFIAKRQYTYFLVSFLLFVFVLFWLTYFFLTPYYHLPGQIVGGEFGKTPLPQFIRKFYSFYSNINFTGSIPACILILSIKYYKDWYKQERESETLMRENKLAELQLLKAQIHPHFLFNTLNNIYSFTLTGSPQAEGLVNKLSGMIDYITTEGEKSLVPVEKEIQLINDYIGLEKVRYGNRLDMRVKITGDYKDKLIAPLLLIPFVENCFKHGASMMRGEQWIHLNIDVEEDELHLHLANSKPAQLNNLSNKKGIGLANVKKRLGLLYPGKHFLKIESLNDTYTVHLRVQLQYLALAGPEHKLMPKLQPA